MAKQSTSTVADNQLQEIRVFKKDKSPLTREDQWRIQFSIGNAILEATREGKSGVDIQNTGTRLGQHHMVVNANTNSGAIYKEAINKLDDFEAFLPEEGPNANSIFCLLPGVAEMVLPQLVAHFAAGTFGGVRKDQVRIPRKPWKPEGATTSYRVYLEVDDDAFAWLKARNWQSYIGLKLVR